MKSSHADNKKSIHFKSLSAREKYTVFIIYRNRVHQLPFALYYKDSISNGRHILYSLVIKPPFHSATLIDPMSVLASVEPMLQETLSLSHRVSELLFNVSCILPQL